MNEPGRPTDRLDRVPGLETTDHNPGDLPPAPASGATVDLTEASDSATLGRPPGDSSITGTFAPGPGAETAALDDPDTTTAHQAPDETAAPSDLDATADASAGFVVYSPSGREGHAATDVDHGGRQRRGPGGEPLPELPGYEILGILGAGGMGVVYKARQVRLDRLVALKMIRAGAGARESDLARFEAEARAVAAIDHPNIIKIYEIDEHDGLPFFALEYLAGGSLAERIAGKPVAVDEAARIVEVMAHAIDVAHRHGIVHRDIKPANVLLAPDGMLKIADFGLVKRLESDSGQTREGSILGSPSYMAPEQTIGAEKAGPAADQYALGATLYEMLTGRPPFRGTSVLDTLDLVRNREAVPPSQFLPRLPRDLETICLKALEKEPARRYPDVAAMAEDLRRFRAGEPIVARPISGPERAWRWCLRNRRLAALGGVAAALLVAFVASLAAFSITVAAKNNQLDRANHDLKTANAEALHQRDLAREAERQEAAERKKAVAAGQAAITQNQQVVEKQRDLILLLEKKLGDVPNLQPVREELLVRASEILETSANAMAQLRDQIGWPENDEEKNWRILGLAHQRLAELNDTRGKFVEATKQIEQVAHVMERLAEKSPRDLGRRIRLIRIHRQLAYFLENKIGDTERSRAELLRSVEVARKAVADAPGDDPIRHELASTLGALAGSEMRLGRLDRARSLLDEEIRLRESFSPAFGDQVENRRELAGLYEKLAELNFKLGNPAESRRLNDRSTAIRAEIAEQHPLWPMLYDVARSYNNSGFFLYPRGHNPAAARVFHQKALDIIEKRAAEDPENLDVQGRLAMTLYYEATCALHSGDRPAAEAGYRRCLEIRERLATEPQAKMPRVDLMVALARCGKYARASAIASELVASPPNDAQIYFQAACGYALSAAAAREEGEQAIRSAPGLIRPRIAAALDGLLARAYAARAVECLRLGKARGWADVVSLEIDPDLEPIRHDPSFQALLAEFRARH